MKREDLEDLIELFLTALSACVPVALALLAVWVLVEEFVFF